MSIATPTWTSVTLVGQPSWTLVPEQSTNWSRIPSISGVTGSGFGQGGFGQGGFGGGGVQSGTATPSWIPWTTD